MIINYVSKIETIHDLFSKIENFYRYCFQSILIANDRSYNSGYLKIFLDIIDRDLSVQSQSDQSTHSQIPG